MFVDLALIHIKAGNGGNGCISFRREKYISAGGPDGGAGGRGGDIVFVVDDNLSTLIDFRYKRKYEAENGGDGKPKNATGRDGKDLVIKVPRGTLLKVAGTGQLIKDLSEDVPFIAAKGGRGGWGNQRFATATRQTPNFAKKGNKGEEIEVKLELKLIADVGLLGFPNVGKSTFLSVVSAANPKIANYHFTTLSPNLGVVYIEDGKSFVIADVPGIIEGASEGQGLGHEFLRHIERCRLLVHMVDISGSEGRDPVKDFETINEELKMHNPELSKAKQIVAGNKADIVFDEGIPLGFEKYIKKKGYDYFRISAATHKGVKQLLNKIAEELEKLPPVARYDSDYVSDYEQRTERETAITKKDGIYYVEGEWLINLMDSVNFDNYESLQYFQKVLRHAGVIKMLEKNGIEEGDTVNIYDFKFDFVR